MSESAKYGGKRTSRKGLKATIAGLVVAFLALVAGFASCGKDDGPDPVPSPSVTTPVITEPTTVAPTTEVPTTEPTTPPATTEPTKDDAPEPTITDPVGPEPTGVTSPPSTD